MIYDVLVMSCINYISVDQHGFVPKRSVTTNLAQFVSECHTSFESEYQMDTVYTDFQAAFDSINHNILLAKLAQLGISPLVIDWLKSYLTDRMYSVRIDNIFSQPFTNTSGVPQGSNLGPLLFTLYINDVTLILPKHSVLLYADDIKLFSVIRSIDDCFALQNNLNLFSNWCVANQLSLCVDKCSAITFSRKRNPLNFCYSLHNYKLSRVSSVRDLGVILDSSLSFREHYHSIISKANRMLGFVIRQTLEIKDPICLKALYTALVRSILESNSVLFSPYCHVWTARIESIQKRFSRIAIHRLQWASSQHLDYLSRCMLLGLQTLEHRRRALQATFVAKLISGDIDSPYLLEKLNLYAPERPLRIRELLRPTFSRSAHSYNAPINQMIHSFNKYQRFFDFNISIAQFKTNCLSFPY